MTITAADIRNAVTTIRYELAGSAIEAMGLPVADALDVYGDALLETYPNASVTVRKANVDASSMEARGEIDGEEFTLIRRHFGAASVACDPEALEVSSDVERSLDADEQDVWGRACEMAAARAAG